MRLRLDLLIFLVCTHIQMDKIAQERILEQIDKENFNSLKYLKDEYFEFKKLNSGKTPYFLMDYMKYDGAPDPIKYIDFKKTYLQFVASVEKDNDLKKITTKMKRLKGH